MAKRRKKEEDYDEVLIDVIDATDDARSFFEKNGSYLLGGLFLLAAIIGGYFAYNYMVKDPKQKEAVEQMYPAQFQFDQDSFKLALTNPGGGYPGFLDIIEQFSGTPAGNLANYYAAVSYVQLGDFDAALSYINSFSAPTDLLNASKNGLLGDITSEKGDLEGALSYYKKAAKTDNELVTPYYLMKLGLLHAKLGNADEATNSFQQIKTKYPSSAAGRDIDKFL